MDDSQLAELKAAFESHDADGNGTLERQEFVSLLRTLGSTLSDEQIEVGFRLVDEDGTGRISLDELERWWGIVREERRGG